MVNIDIQDTENERLLWRAVIEQAMADLSTKDKKKRYTYYKTKAYEWFDKPDGNFYLVCELAGLDPITVLAQANKLLNKKF